MAEIMAKHTFVKVFVAQSVSTLESDIQKWLSSQSEDLVIYEVKYAAFSSTVSPSKEEYSALVLYGKRTGF